MVDFSGKTDLLTLAALIARARLLVTVDSAPMHLAAATRTPQVILFGPTNPFHWRPRESPALILQGESTIADDRFLAEAAAHPDEPNLDGSGDRCYGDAAVESGSAAIVMSKAEGAKVKLSFWETMRTGWKPYRRLYSYATPYKWRFALGLAFGLAFGLV